MRAWIFQDSRQKKKLGVKAPWSVGWYTPDGKKRSKRIGSRSMAQKYARKIEGQLAAGTYEDERRKHWRDFRREYEQHILPALATRTRESIRTTLNHFERICRPVKLAAIRTSTIDEFISQRQRDSGRKPGSTVSKATINHDLRHLKAALHAARDWGYLPSVPRFRQLREPRRIGTVVTPEHFKAIYENCSVATMPRGLHCQPECWWNALLVFAITTGWRIEEILSFRRDDINLRSGQILTRASDNKGCRDDVDYLPDVTLQHVRTVRGFDPLVFPWPHHRRP